MYREAAAPAPVEYPVRTPPAYWAVIAALGVIAMYFGASLLPLVAARMPRRPSEWLTLALASFFVALPALYFVASREYRARGALRIARDRVEIPDGLGRTTALVTTGLRIVVEPINVRVVVVFLPLPNMRRGAVITFANGLTTRRISTLTLRDPRHEALLLADLERVVRGEEPLGPNERHPARRTEAVPDDLDARLDRELADFDD
jgi:hypothetical protein